MRNSDGLPMSTERVWPGTPHYQSHQDNIVARVERYGLQPSRIQPESDGKGGNQRENTVNNNDCFRVRREHYDRITKRSDGCKITADDCLGKARSKHS